MTGTGEGARRPRREIELEGTRWSVFDAWRGPSGLGLAYFATADGASQDRRGPLEAGQRLDALTESEIEALWRAAAPLTSTERRVRDARGDWWLVQAVGPVWAEGGSASDAVGVRARCLSSEREPRERMGTRFDELSEADCRSWLEGEAIGGPPA